MKIDYFAKINELKAQKAELADRADEMISGDKFGDDLAGVQNSIRTISAQIDQLTEQAALSAATAEPAPANPTNDKTLHVFDSLGEQLRAVRNAARGDVDDRLLRVNNAVKGANETTGAEGGFAVQEDFAREIFETAAKTGDILSRVNTYTVGAGANSVRWYNIDETDVSAHVYGGVQVYWTDGEGESVTATKPKLRQVKCDLEKMMGVAYATSEMLEDAAFMSSFFGRAFSTATERLLEDAIISGTGTGQPKGILSSDALVAVKRTTASDVTPEDIFAMWGASHAKYRRNTVWLAHPDLENKLQGLTIDGTPIWMPEGTIANAPYQRLLGRPVIYTDNCPALGTKGDMILADLSKYTLIRKGSAKQAWSMHVEFLTDQMAFRIVLRCNGTPELTQAVTLKNSTTKRSAFVALDVNT